MEEYSIVFIVLLVIFTDSKFPLESVVIIGLVVSLTGIVVSAVAVVIGFIKSKR